MGIGNGDGRETFDSTVFESKETDDPRGDRTDHYFNSGSGQGAEHGHVVEIRHDDGSVSYPYVRDADGNVYADD